MIRKLQIKFVAMCMILVTAVLGVVFTAVFFSAKQNIEVISHPVSYTHLTLPTIDDV